MTHSLESLKDTAFQIQDLSSAVISSPPMDDANDASDSDVVLETPFSDPETKSLNGRFLLTNQEILEIIKNENV